MKSIPFSKIDTRIKELRTCFQGSDVKWLCQELERLKKESEEMIPLSVVEALIDKHIGYVKRGNEAIGETDYRYGAMTAYEDLKKELTKERQK